MTTDPTPAAAPLTAEQIAAIQEHYEQWASNGTHLLGLLDSLDTLSATDRAALSGSIERSALKAENAALRDRLARAEAQVRDALTGDLGVAQIDEDTWYWQRGHVVQTYHPTMDDAIDAALLATPTDGAAREGDGR